MPLLLPPPQSPPARGDKRRLAAIALAVIILFAGVAAWTAVHPGGYGRSRAGCVSVTIPSTTGGAMLHQCGSRAHAMCREASRHRDRLSLLIRPACRAAGLS